MCDLCGSVKIHSIDGDALLYKCSDCNYIFDNPRPTIQEIINFYSKPAKYDLWLSELSLRDGLWKRRATKLARYIRGGALLDVGAGIGQFLQFAKPYFTELVGTEVSSSAVELAKSKYNLEILHGEVEKIDFGTKKFQVITLFHVLEHVHSPRNLIQKCYDLLSSSGMLFIAVPNDIESIKMRIKKLLNTKLNNRYEGTKMALKRIVLDGTTQEIHLSHFTPHVLAKFLMSYGFEIVDNTIDSYYVASGKRKVLKDIYYGIHWLINRLFGTNLYDTIWIVAKKI